MQYVKKTCQIEESIKKSKFIGMIAPTLAETEALQFIQSLHKAHPNASHVVFAYRILTPDGMICRFNDAGEPSGTAGKPIFHHLEGKNIINTTVAVIRYFGGVKLGAGGLTRAYGNCAGNVIDNAEFSNYVILKRLRLILDYHQLQELEYFLKHHDGHIVQQDFKEQIRLTVELPEVQADGLINRFNSQI